jgi:hypothetical protein
MHAIHIRGLKRRDLRQYEDALGAAARVLAQWDGVPAGRIWGTYIPIETMTQGVEPTDFASALVFVDICVSPRSKGERVKLPAAIAEAVGSELQVDPNQVAVTVLEVPSGSAYWLGHS